MRLGHGHEPAVVERSSLITAPIDARRIRRVERDLDFSRRGRRCRGNCVDKLRGLVIHPVVALYQRLWLRVYEGVKLASLSHVIASAGRFAARLMYSRQGKALRRGF